MEGARGPPRQAQPRLEVLAGLATPPTSPAAAELAVRFIATGSLPPAAKVDAVQLAVATLATADYLLIWSCRHLANGQILRSRGRDQRLTDVHGHIISPIPGSTSRPPDCPMKGAPVARMRVFFKHAAEIIGAIRR